MAPIFLGLSLVAGSIIILQVSLTRVFAILMWHHLTYMVVSIAMLGFGAAGSLLTASVQGRDTRFSATTATWLSAGYGVAVIGALFLATKIPLDTLALVTDRSNFVRLAAIYAILFVPFLLGGAVVGLVLTRLAEHVNRLYFVDLLGSALGGALSVWLLSSVDPASAVVGAAVIGLIAAACFAVSAGGKLVYLQIPAVVVGVLLFLSVSGAGQGLGLSKLAFGIPFAPSKALARFNSEPDLVRIPSATAEVEVGPVESLFPSMGGDFGQLAYTLLGVRVVGQDGTAPTFLYEGAADLESFSFLDDSQAGSGYVALHAAGLRDPRVLVIGVGGGIDVMIGLAHGAKKVTAVEFNSGMIDMVTHRFDDFLGGLFRPGGHPLADRIELVHGEGRSYVRSQEESFDLIQLSGVDSYTALSTGAYTLAESYLYTKEAIQDFYSHLREGGIINYSRFILTDPRKPRETLRLTNIAFEALSELGEEDPASQIAVFQGKDWASTMIRRGGFTPDEIDALSEFALLEGFHGLIFDPLHRPGTPFSPSPRYDHLAIKSLEEWAERQQTADRGAASTSGGNPELAAAISSGYLARRRGANGEAERALRQAVSALDPLPRYVARRKVDKVVGEHVAAAQAGEAPIHRTRDYFTDLLRGDEAQRAEFISGYDYDLTPATDDAPFFFNYYRYGGLLARWVIPERDYKLKTELYHSDYPVGHMILIASLLQITALGVFFILVPLSRLRRAGLSMVGRGRVFAYFAALGAGFMFIEIVLMQKMMLFLGHPTFAVTVVLTTLLASAGLGSLAAGRAKGPARPLILRLAAIIVTMILLEVFALRWILPAFLGLDFGVRAVIAVAIVAPLGFFLGMPFPLGIRVVLGRSPELVPWAWAINAFLSVFSSLLCIVLAMAIGFTLVLISTAVIYAVGLTLFVTGEPASDAADRI
jgi:hypothetical protein